MKRQIEKNCIIVPLPSKGECYPHKKGEVSIAYMTAMDENILADKKLREENKAIDTLLEKKILDKDFKVDELYVEDRNAILLALIKDGYGSRHINPIDGKDMDLNTIEYSESKLKGDENGWFDYVQESQPLVKFRTVRHSDEIEPYKLLEGINNENFIDILYTTEKYLLKQMIVCVNGKADQTYIDEYVDSLSHREWAEFIRFINNNMAKVNTDINFEAVLISKIKEQDEER